MESNPRKCKCGCGLQPHPGRKYIHGHNAIDNNPMESPSSRRRLSIAQTVRTTVSDKTRERMSRSQTGNQNALGHSYKVSPETSYKMSVSHLGLQNALGYNPSPEARKRMSIAKNKYYANPKNLSDHTRSVIAGSHKRPTKPEQKLINVISDYGSSYTYNGNNGRVVIDGLCPDFTHNTKPIVILVNGTYWHNNPRKEQEVLRRYRKEGYEVITLQDTEINDYSDDYLAFLLMMESLEPKRVEKC